MGDPRHPVKVVVVIHKGAVSGVYSDRKAHVRLFIADYDVEDSDGHPHLGKDKDGDDRILWEQEIIADTPAVRTIINKKGGEGADAV